MNTTTSKRILGLAAIAVVAFGTYTAVSAFAHGVGGMGTSGFQGMMHGQTGTTTQQGTMGPGMMMGRGMMGGQQAMGPGMVGNQQNMGPGMMGGVHHGMMGTTHPFETGKDLDGLKTRLSITVDQETVWETYVQATSDLAQTHNTMFNVMHGNYENITDAEQSRITFMEDMIAKRKTAFTAYQALLDTLTEDQKSKSTMTF